MFIKKSINCSFVIKQIIIVMEFGDLEEVIIKRKNMEVCDDFNILEHCNKKVAASIALSSLLLREMHEKLHGFMNVLEEKSDHQFFYLCRVTKKTFGKLTEEVSEHQSMKFSNRGRERINSRVSVMITLWYLGKQCTFTEIAEQFGITKSSVHTHIEIVIDIINEIFDFFIKWPSLERAHVIEKEFKSLTNFPGVIGSLDGCHIRIKAPEVHQKDYLDRTMNHSVNLMAVCDANKVFTYINVGFPGSAHDQRVFSLSSLGRNLEENYRKLCYNDKHHLIGDSAFALKPYIMVPFKDFGNFTPEKENFNKKLSATRRVIENAFGWLKGRFRRLKFIDADIHRISKIIRSACILHNITLESDEEKLFLEMEIGSKYEDESLSNPNIEVPESLSGITKRERICTLLSRCGGT